ncbi:Zn(II)2Cys6 transcription factor [Aspergillus sclerotiicarbonarius CBS 121057]|uniref:Zn(II)2Cys6 transcription factor n=1 Tax=Aspergillus sclerotiicarbonarius (strain CBS 121057 / IBT 28362) TaxID=1448318 RepID=A0A319E847_ASPSB|nr:Zn(II)2Cys6 transcription factor [Aspergillus sclerotiicarbonarius CBS 121057]
MDCGSTGTAAGIDPKILDNWQSDPFPISSWEHHTGYDQSLEWDASQDSSQGDADIVDLNTLNGPLSRDPSVVPVVGQPGDYRGNESSKQAATSPGKFSINDGPIEGTVSGTISPRTLPSSADDNFHLDESWPPFQLFNAMTAGLPMEAPLLYPYAKEPTSTNTVIVEDAGDLSQGQGLSDVPSDQFLSFQNLPQAFPFSPAEPWTTPTASATADHMSNPNPVSLSMGQQSTGKRVGHIRDYQGSIRSLDSRWLEGLESQLPSNMTSPGSLSIPPDAAFFKEERQNQEGSQYKSESSSVSGDFPGVYDPYSTTNDEIPAFAERQLEDDGLWKNAQKDSSPPETSQPLQNATAFMVSEDPSEAYFVPVSTRPRASSSAQRAPARPPALALQSVATVRKRKQRNSSVHLDQNLPKPLQIVQEDGQGGSIASADFISPPRGARRKGPLSMVGRANAGLRRKNKDTCVQCRLNKRKCDGNAPCDACRPTLHEQPCARACFANIVEYGTCNYVSQRAINHPTVDGSRRVRMDIPFEFDLNDLISFLGERQGRFNIRAKQSWGSLYVLDLGETYKFLRGLSEYNGNSKSNFLEFIDRRIVESKDKSKNWLTCVKDCDPMNNVYSLLSRWNNMPSRASYSFVPLQSGGQEKAMDINNPEDRREILLAAQLSRIICRMLEVEGFRKLERDFYNIKWKQISQDTHMRFLSELGHILLTLRWRVSWWRRLGDGGREPDPSKQHYVDRVDLLCRILYVYYTCVLAKLPSWCAADVPKGIWSTYADAENPVWDDFPVDPTDDGFQQWIDRGQELVEQSGAPTCVAKI